MNYTEKIEHVHTGLWLTRTNFRDGWYERGSYGTAFGYVVIYRQGGIGQESDYTELLFIADGRLYSRTFDRCLSDASLKIQAGKLAKYAYQKERKAVV